MDALLNATHTPHNAGPRAMSRNTRQAMLDGIDRKRKRGYKVKAASYTCDDGGGGGGCHRKTSSKEGAKMRPVWGPVGPDPGPACPVAARSTGFWAGSSGSGPG